MVEYLCCSSGGMVDTLVSGTSGLCRVGSNPISSTIFLFKGRKPFLFYLHLMGIFFIFS